MSCVIDDGGMSTSFQEPQFFPVAQNLLQQLLSRVRRVDVSDDPDPKSPRAPSFSLFALFP